MKIMRSKQEQIKLPNNENKLSEIDDSFNISKSLMTHSMGLTNLLSPS
jgi:hypothetical protein